MEYYKAVMTGQDHNPTLEAIAALPAEKRYLTRVIQCLDWALADFDDETVKLDMPYMPNLAETVETLQIRLFQLQTLVDTLRGTDDHPHKRGENFP